MWDYFYARRAMELGSSIDMLNSPFAFPRLPPRASPLGISNTGKIKDAIVHDKEIMMNRLGSHYEMFQHYALGLFDLLPNQQMPGHPMHQRTQMYEGLKEENEKLRQENQMLKGNKNKEKKN